MIKDEGLKDGDGENTTTKNIKDVGPVHWYPLYSDGQPLRTCFPKCSTLHLEILRALTDHTLRTWAHMG